MDSFRFDSRLFLVMALFGILSTQVILAEDETTIVSTAANAASQDPTEETTTSLRNGPEAGASVSVQTTEMSLQGAGEQESATSAREPNAEETVSLQSQAATDETRITSVETGKPITSDETSTIFTGTSSTDEKPTTASVQRIAPTNSHEETTATMKVTVQLATTARDEILMGQDGSQGQTETAEIGKEQEQSTTVISSTALPGSTCQWKDLTPMKMKCTNKVFNINGLICKQKNSYRKRSPDNSKKYTYFVRANVSDEADPSQIQTSAWNITSDEVYEKDSKGVAEHLKREWTNDTFVIKLQDVDGVIILEVPMPMMLHDAKQFLEDGFRGAINTPDDSSSPATTLPAVLIGHTDTKRLTDTTTSRPNIWEAHLGLFLTVVILISVCIVITLMCFLCMKWRGRGRDKHPDKQPISMEEAREAPTAVSNPIPDAEMIQDEAPMQERENPAVTPNGGGQHISKADEDNGWVVPLDELSKAEKEKPEVENTRL